METLIKVVKAIFIPSHDLRIPIEDVPMVRGYYERINRCAIHVDSEVVTYATSRHAYVNPGDGASAPQGPFCPLL